MSDFISNRNVMMPVMKEIPFTMTCNGCGKRMDQGDKLYALKEDVTTAKGDPNLGRTEINSTARFHLSCLRCGNKFFIKKEDGQDVVIESGATLVPKNFRFNDWNKFSGY